MVNIFDSAFAGPLDVAESVMGERVTIGGVETRGVVGPVEARENDRPGPGKTALVSMVHLTAARAMGVALVRNARVVLNDQTTNNVLVLAYVNNLGAQGVDVYLSHPPSVGDIMEEG